MIRKLRNSPKIASSPTKKNEQTTDTMSPKRTPVDQMNPKSYHEFTEDKTEDAFRLRDEQAVPN